ncbi:hypothetical protein Q9L58_007042 [Maublancomyces gigas]|uniref:Protein kinase domain-containing protein n=1 Tax=Discina gigas TaxID=1032678 RepID=A0ABR3GDL7_9PEZI
MAEVTGLALSVLGGADICVRAGRSLYAKYRSYKDAEVELSELSLRLKTHWYKIEAKISLIKDLDHALEENLKIHFTELFELLSRKLEDARVRLQTIELKQTRLNRVKFAALVKRTLEEAITQLDKWQNQLDWTWFLMARITNPIVDQQLTAQRTRTSDSALAIMRLRETMRPAPQTTEKSIFIPASDLGHEKIVSLPYSPFLLAKLFRPERNVLVDIVASRGGPGVGPEVAKVGIRDIARVLSQANPMKFGIMACRGVVESTDSGVGIFKFVFEIPDHLNNPRSLRSLLVDSRGQRRPPYPLSERFELAKRLARSVMFVHSSNMVHKNIRPDTIVIFQGEISCLGIPFLLGFEKIRAVNAFTNLMGDAEWQKNLYRHPNRQGLRHEESYKMQHDIYSFGVCLLEIGLWSSFIFWNEETGSFEPDPDLHISELLAYKDQRKKANGIKEILLDMATKQLPSTMGPIYAEIAVACLMCLDRGNNGFGNEEEFTDEDGISVGVRYVEKVLMRLEEISV